MWQQAALTARQRSGSKVIRALVSVMPLACQPALSSCPTLAYQPPSSITLVIHASPTDPFITAAGVLRSCMSWRSAPLRHGRSD